MHPQNDFPLKVERDVITPIYKTEEVLDRKKLSAHLIKRHFSQTSTEIF